MQLSIQKDEYTDGCILVLDSEKFPDAESGAMACPDIDAEWTSEEEFVGTHTLTVFCKKCGECGVLTDCCPRPIPSSLTLSLFDGGECPRASGSFSLSFEGKGQSAGVPIWIFRNRNAEICDDVFDVTLWCEGGFWFIETVVKTAGGCVDSGGHQRPPSESCDPLMLEFPFIAGECIAGEYPCCEPGGQIGGRVTE